MKKILLIALFLVGCRDNTVLNDVEYAAFNYCNMVSGIECEKSLTRCSAAPEMPFRYRCTSAYRETTHQNGNRTTTIVPMTCTNLVCEYGSK